ncbi:MAG: helix-turn-helix domain-containing protein [Thermaceae bacterium]|nr:helix-turn-helix domain-containing protein [Thermaceae bacterium]
MALKYFLRPKGQVSSTGYSQWVLLLNGPLPPGLEEATPPEDSVKEKLECIETTFDLRVVRVAELLGVSRQAVYDWKQGKSLSDENHRRLDALYRAARRFKEAGLKPDYTTKHRLIGGELEFIQALGQDPLGAVEKLIVVTERGKKQREWLEEHLKARPAPQGSIADELPPHYPGE